MDRLRYFATIFHKGEKFCDYLFALLSTKPLLQRIYSIRKEFALKGSKYFPSRLDTFPKED